MKYKKSITAILAALISVSALFTACTNNSQEEIADESLNVTQEITESVSLALDTAHLPETQGETHYTPKEQENTVVLSSNAFENKLNSQMPKDTNYMFSPLSIKMALALAAEGAKGDTQKEIIDILGEKDISSLEKNTLAIIDSYSNIKDFDMDIANAVFVNSDNTTGKISSDYKNTVQQKLNAKAQTVNNNNAVNTVNDWCKKETNNEITKLISDSNFASILANAVYFKADWEKQFDENDTKEDIFHQRGGIDKKTMFMHNSDEFGYYKDNTVEMIELPYKANFMHNSDEFGYYRDDSTEIIELPYKTMNLNVSMYIALSDDKRIDFNSYTDKLTNKNGSITIPKFKTEFSIELSDTLKSMGADKIFSDDADFSMIFEDTSDKFKITKVLHKTYIDVTEKGTEAAAVTDIEILNDEENIEPEPPFDFIADKPFTYFIKDNTNNEILFMGEYAFVE